MSDPRSFAFSKRRLEAIPIPAIGRVQYRDTGCPGLIVRVAAGGSRVFYWYRKVNGKPQRVRLGDFPGMSAEQARKAAARENGKAAAGRDPAAEKREKRQEITIADLFADWLTYAQTHKRPRSWQEGQRLYEQYIGPRFGTRKVSTLKPKEIETWHQGLGEKRPRSDGKKGRLLGGPYVANRCLELLSAMYGRAPRLGFTGSNPTQHVPPFQEQARDRFLQPAELPRFFQSLAQEPPIYQDFYLLALLVGARKANLLAMRWAEADFDAAEWKVVAKGGKAVTINLCPEAISILRRRRLEVTGEWVFPAQKRGASTGHLTEPKPAWKRICKRAGLPDLRIHDCRRSFGSWQALSGASLIQIGKALGHRPGSPATAVYARLTDESVRRSIETAAERMLAFGGVKLLDVAVPTDAPADDHLDSTTAAEQPQCDLQ
ncbi:MAG: tyrosine-type recombinase/integrase [Pirellulales bacterium]|nr:tyrosine-type recombinase/integrase [Pirellulales bacterium]